MSRPRAADDFKTIRIRIEELRREKLPGHPTPTTGTIVAGALAPVAGACSPTSAEAGAMMPAHRGHRHTGSPL